MSALYPFRALRPLPEVASRVASVPYDVVSTDEARALAADEGLSFLHVTRAEIDLPADVYPYDAAVYARAVLNFAELVRTAPLVVEMEPSLYFYRLRMGSHVQVGLAGCFSVEEYDGGFVKKHEKTRKDKEDDRTRHVTELRAQTGVVFLTYRAAGAIDAIAERVTLTPPLYDFVAPDEIAHTVWRVTGPEMAALVEAFGALPAVYIADGHHRAASASRACAALSGSGESGHFIAVAFPDTQVQILPYNRAVKDLAGQTAEQFLAALGARVRVEPGEAVPARSGEVSMFLAGAWYRLTLPLPLAGTPRDEALDVAVLQSLVLEPLLNVGDPRTDKRIDFIGGARGTAELERVVRDGRAAVAFSLFPTTVDDLMAIADAGGIMPPKSTWFEPKLRDGLLVHLI